MMGSPSWIERATIKSPVRPPVGLDVVTGQLDILTSQIASYPTVEPSWNPPPKIHYKNDRLGYDAVAVMYNSRPQPVT
jgi:hypothetical protein